MKVEFSGQIFEKY